MVDSPAFQKVCEEIEAGTELNQLEARGTVRLALKQAGLEAPHVTSEQIAVVLRQVLPGELATRGVADGAAVCETIASRIASLDLDSTQVETPEAVFQRLGS